MVDAHYADFHVHTRFSPCGHAEATMAAMIAWAQAKGLAAMGFSDHVTPEPVPGCAFYDGQQIEVLIKMRAALDVLVDATSPELDLLVGVEADYTLAGARCLDAAMVELVDHAVCAASHFHLPAAPVPEADTPQAKAKLMVELAREMLTLDGVDIWAHPFDCSAMRPLAPIMAEIDVATQAELIALANAREVAIEINGGPGENPAYRAATKGFFSLAREMGARFTVTADAHHPDHFERLDIAVDWARDLGIDAAAFLTADELRARHRRKAEAWRATEHE
ncbi:MAG: PHP domain-containing protein [Anaerolineae bacterium]